MGFDHFTYDSLPSNKILDRSKLKAFADDNLNVTHNMKCVFNPLPNNKILVWSRLKAFADNKINVTEKLKLVLGRVENIVGKEENAVHQHFLLFPQYFQKTTFSGSLKVGIVW